MLSCVKNTAKSSLCWVEVQNRCRRIGRYTDQRFVLFARNSNDLAAVAADLEAAFLDRKGGKSPLPRVL